jgi:hypothetical protein
MSYRAFISYNHAADYQLAPALQSALHKFGKSFYQLRAMRVFRDKTSLHVTPGLWPLIQQALKGIGILHSARLARCAHSQWVQAEIEEWIKLRSGSVDRLLIVLTGGRIEWDATVQDFDWNVTTALPLRLKGAFQREPLYTDLRWAKKTTDLSLRNPQFLDDAGSGASFDTCQEVDFEPWAPNRTRWPDAIVLEKYVVNLFVYPAGRRMADPATGGGTF